MREQPRLAFSIPEVAAQLGISRTHAYAMAKKGEIPTVWIGNRCLVPAEPLKEKLARNLPNVAYRQGGDGANEG